MELLAAGVNHTTADVALRERLAFAAEHTQVALAALQKLPGVAEAALLSTCNRMELYCLCDRDLQLADWLAQWHQLPVARINSALYVHHQDDALRHMMRVASGLDSRVLGEPQILGQMHAAYQAARDAGTLKNRLEQIFQQVFATAKRVRSETAIGENPVSVASAAVAFARHIFADLTTSHVLLIGAGAMIALVARHLRDQGVTRLTIANRTPARAAALAAEVGAEVVPLAQLTEALAGTDIVIACTGSPLPLVSLRQVEEALHRRRRKPIFMVDLAVPRDVAPEVGGLEDIYLYTLDHLQTVIDAGLTERQQAAAEGQQLIEQALLDWQQKRRENHAVDTLRAYRQVVEEMSEQELIRARQALEHGQSAEEVMARFRHDLVNKLLHHPSVILRKLAADERFDELELARELLLPESLPEEVPPDDGDGGPKP
jgi:glutamyl-tRNA reductase